MSRVLVAIGGEPASGVVLEVARAMADLLDADVDAIHVHDPAIGPRQGIDPAARLVEGEVPARLLEESSADDVEAVVVGIRAMPGGGRPAGHVALHLLQRTRLPVVAVPPDVAPQARSLSRPLIPLEGVRPPSAEVMGLAERFCARDRPPTGLHIIDRHSAPSFADRWDDATLWIEQFRLRYCPSLDEVHVEAGDVGGRIIDAATRHGADVIVLEWSQQLDESHAQVIQDLLTHASVPLLVLPDRRSEPVPTPWIQGREGST